MTKRQPKITQAEQEMITQATTTVRGMLADWKAAREALKEWERAEHPDLTDHHGRVWVWKDKDLYTHCKMAWTDEMILRPHGLPRAEALTNPNYDFCEICRGGR